MVCNLNPQREWFKIWNQNYVKGIESKRNQCNLFAAHIEDRYADCWVVSDCLWSWTVGRCLTEPTQLQESRGKSRTEWLTQYWVPEKRWRMLLALVSDECFWDGFSVPTHIVSQCFASFRCKKVPASHLQIDRDVCESEWQKTSAVSQSWKRCSRNRFSPSTWHYEAKRQSGTST